MDSLLLSSGSVTVDITPDIKVCLMCRCGFQERYYYQAARIWRAKALRFVCVI